MAAAPPTPSSSRPSRPSRPPVRWATHNQHILFVVAATVGGLLFGVSYTVWPLSPVERWIGVGVLVVVAGIWVRVASYLVRPVEEPRRTRR